MIKIEKLSKVFCTEEIETSALNEINMNVQKGEFIAIMGPSGCGKSTLLNILGLLDNPSSGHYLLDGKEVGNLKEKERTIARKGNIGFVFQNFNLIEEMTVFENVEIPLIYLDVNKSERKKRVEETLKKMNIDHRSGHLPNQLSGGQQQRVAIARALVNEPVIILADEATGNLDTRTSFEILTLMQKLHQEEHRTIIFVTHNPELAHFSSRNIVIRDGRIKSDSYNNDIQSAAEVLKTLPKEE